MRRIPIFIAVITAYQRTLPRHWWRPILRMER